MIWDIPVPLLRHSGGPRDTQEGKSLFLSLAFHLLWLFSPFQTPHTYAHATHSWKEQEKSHQL